MREPDRDKKEQKKIRNKSKEMLKRRKIKIKALTALGFHISNKWEHPFSLWCVCVCVYDVHLV